MEDNQDKAPKAVITPLMQEALDFLQEEGKRRPQVEYRIFRDRYLPLLANRDKPVNLGEWIKIAGSTYNYVEVVDRGEVKYVVPPLHNRQRTCVHEGDPMNSLGVALSEVGKQARDFPKAADRIIGSVLEKRFDIEDVRPEDIAAWNKILTDHGYPAVEISAKDGTSAEVSVEETKITIEEQEDF